MGTKECVKLVSHKVPKLYILFVYILKCNDKGSHNIHTPDISVIIPVHIETY